MEPNKEQEEITTESQTRTALEAAKAELVKAKRELNSAKERAAQSWLDSKPLVDELEDQKSNLAEAQRISKASNAAISELESRLEAVNKSIKSRREDRLKAESTVREFRRALDQTRDETESIKLGTKGEKQEISKMRQTLRLRKQRARALRLALHAALLEGSGSGAVQQVRRRSETDRAAVVQLSHERCRALARRARRKISRVDRRASVSREQKIAAEAAHELALSRLNELCPSNRSWSMERRNAVRLWYTERGEEGEDAVGEGEVATNGTRDSPPKSHAKTIAQPEGGNPHESRDNKNKIKKKKKPSILHRMTKCLVQNLMH